MNTPSLEYEFVRVAKREARRRAFAARITIFFERLSAICWLIAATLFVCAWIGWLPL
jgi:hypothetical protein